MTIKIYSFDSEQDTLFYAVVKVEQGTQKEQVSQVFNCINKANQWAKLQEQALKQAFTAKSRCKRRDAKLALAFNQFTQIMNGLVKANKGGL